MFFGALTSAFYIYASGICPFGGVEANYLSDWWAGYPSTGQTVYGYGSGYVAAFAFVYLVGKGGSTPQFGAANNQIELVNYEGTTGYPSSPVGYNLVGPDKMVVVDDVWDYCDRCTSTVRRKVKYQVLNSDGSPAPNIPLGELVSYGSSTCTLGRPIMDVNSCTVAQNEIISDRDRIRSLGMYATDANGEFTDNWTMGADGYTPTGCGYNVNFDQWQLCGLAIRCSGGICTYPNAGLTFASLKGWYHNDNIDNIIGTTDYILPNAGPLICPPNVSGCPDAIPWGTIITP